MDVCAATWRCRHPVIYAIAWSHLLKTNNSSRNSFVIAFLQKANLTATALEIFSSRLLPRLPETFFEAIKIASEALAIKGRFLPTTSANTILVARMDDGSLVRGESRIRASARRIAKTTLEPLLAPALSETLQAIVDADLVTIGPGSLYTSIIPNLLASGIPEALAATHATRVYIANLMTEANESLDMSVADHIECIYAHAGRPILDYALLNIGPIPAVLCEQYATAGAERRWLIQEGLKPWESAVSLETLLRKRRSCDMHSTDWLVSYSRYSALVCLRELDPRCVIMRIFNR